MIKEEFTQGQKVRKKNDHTEAGTVESMQQDPHHVIVTVKKADSTEFKCPQHELEADTTA